MPGSTESTDRRVVLELLRVELLARLEGAENVALPSLSRELRQVLAELDGLPSAEKSAPADEIARKRAARRRKAASA